MLLTFTANPSLDLLFEASRLVWDDANRLPMPRRRPGGQGINVARAARTLGLATEAVALLGGRVGDDLERELVAEGTPVHRVPIEGETRVFVGVREHETGRNLLLNSRGPHITPDEVQCALVMLQSVLVATRPSWFACCGSLPPGVPADFYRQASELARAAGASVVTDCDGDALRLAAPVCDLLVPNQHEAERLLERSIGSVDDAAAAVSDLATQFALTAAITLGDRGAVASDGEVICFAQTNPATGGSAVGAGDAFLAALIAGLMNDLRLEDLLRDAVAAGTAVLSSQGSDLLCEADYRDLRKSARVRRLG